MKEQLNNNIALVKSSSAFEKIVFGWVYRTFTATASELKTNLEPF